MKVEVPSSLLIANSAYQPVARRKAIVVRWRDWRGPDFLKRVSLDCQRVSRKVLTDSLIPAMSRLAASRLAILCGTLVSSICRTRLNIDLGSLPTKLSSFSVASSSTIWMRLYQRFILSLRGCQYLCNSLHLALTCSALRSMITILA